MTSENVQADLSSISDAHRRVLDFSTDMEDFITQIDQEEKANRGKSGMQDRISEVAHQHEYSGGLRDSFAAAQATGYEPLAHTGNKFFDTYTAQGQQLDQLRVLPKGTKSQPKEIMELSKDPQAIAQAQQCLVPLINNHKQQHLHHWQQQHQHHHHRQQQQEEKGLNQETPQQKEQKLNRVILKPMYHQGKGQDQYRVQKIGHQRK